MIGYGGFKQTYGFLDLQPEYVKIGFWPNLRFLHLIG
jgi:hypothetical protein